MMRPRIEATSEGPRLTPPRYRVEARLPGQAAFIVGFADTPLVYRSRLACRAARLLGEGSRGEFLVVHQDTEAVVGRRAARTVAAPQPGFP